MVFKLEKRLFYQGKICLFLMLLNDTEKTLRTDSSKHNPLFFFKSQAQTNTSYRQKKILAFPLQESNLFHARPDDPNGLLQALSNLSSSDLSKYTHSQSISFPAPARLIKLTGVLKASFSDSAISEIQITPSALLLVPIAVWEQGARPAREEQRRPMRQQDERTALVQLYWSQAKDSQTSVYFNACLLCFTVSPWNSANHSRRTILNIWFGKVLTSNRFICNTWGWIFFSYKLLLQKKIK